MSRLRAELERLFFLPGVSMAAHDAPGASPLCHDGQVRVLVCELTGPSSWSLLQRLWTGVQDEPGWPAPAIAVNGVDACQLWMPLAQPVAADEALQVLQALCARHLADVPPHRLRLWPASAEQGHAMPPLVPAACAPGDVWSAFVAPDLAPVFEDTPWLDVPPNLDGQAELLSRISLVSSADWLRARAAWCAAGVPGEARTASTTATKAARAAADDPLAMEALEARHTALPAQRARLGQHQDPRAFLLAVMNADEVNLALRIEAAKALLQASGAT